VAEVEKSVAGAKRRGLAINISYVRDEGSLCSFAKNHSPSTRSSSLVKVDLGCARGGGVAEAKGGFGGGVKAGGTVCGASGGVNGTAGGCFSGGEVFAGVLR